MSEMIVEQLDDMQLLLELPCEVVRTERGDAECNQDAVARVHFACDTCGHSAASFVCSRCLSELKGHAHVTTVTTIELRLGLSTSCCKSLVTQWRML